MPWQFAKYYRRPFQSLFYSMDHYFNESREFYQKVQAQNHTKPLEFDQDLWMKEKSASRASFIMGLAGIEAFTNNVLKDYSKRNKEDLPEAILSKYQKSTDVGRWRLIDKVYFLPTLCNDIFNPPAIYFKRDSRAFKLFEELVKIRNSIVHGRPEPFMVLFRLKPNKVHEMNDSFINNFWPLSKIPKDFSSFNYECAKTAYENIKCVRDSLVKFLDKVDDKYMKEEKIKLISPIIRDDLLTEIELLKNWKKYVNI